MYINAVHTGKNVIINSTIASACIPSADLHEPYSNHQTAFSPHPPNFKRPGHETYTQTNRSPTTTLPIPAQAQGLLKGLDIHVDANNYGIHTILMVQCLTCT